MQIGTYPDRKVRPQWRSFATFLCGMVFLTSSLAAQTGTVTGRISNQATGDFLTGARVQADGKVVTADRGGIYEIELPPGSYNLSVSYTGLDAEQATVQVQANETITRDFALTSDVYEMDAFTVAADREGSALAITQQREAPNVKNVVAVDHFGRPNANPADLLQRMPGVVGDITGSEVRDIFIRGIGGDFNSVSIDGNSVADSGSAGVSRGMQFQHLTTSNVEAIELIKALTPDMSAEAIGGSVNLRTTSILDRPAGRSISYTLGTSYRTWDGSIDRNEDSIGLDEMRFRYSDVFSAFGGEDNLGITVTAGYRTPLIHVDYTYHTHQVSVPDPSSPRYQYHFGTREYQSEEKRFNSSFRIDYRLNDTTRLFLNTMYGTREEDQNVWRFDWTAVQNSILPGYSQEYTEATNGTVQLQTATIDKDGRSYNVNPGGITDLGNLKLEYDLFENYSKTLYPASDTFNLQLTGIGGIIDRRERGMWDPEWTPTGPNADRVWDLNNYRHTSTGFGNNLQRRETWRRGAKIDARYDFDNLPVPAYVKAGINVNEMELETFRDNHRWRYQGTDFGRFYDPNYGYSQYNGTYPVMPFQGLPNRGGAFDIKQDIQENPELYTDDVLYNAQQKHIWDRYLRERISAAYVMGDVTLNRLAILAGVRGERTDVKGTGYLQMLTPEERARRAAWVGPVTDEENIRRADEEYGRRQTSTGNYTNFFPSVHFRYSATNSLLLRASYSTGIGRPPLSNIIPLDSVNFELERVTRSNPGLGPRMAQNFDVSAEYYFEPVGLFSVGGFVKEIDDFIATEISTIGPGADNGFDGEFVGWELRQPRNAGSARVRGLEINYQQQLSFLPGFLKGFGVYANYTRLETEGNPATGAAQTTPRPVPGFVPTSANGGITYRGYGFSAALQATHVGTYMLSSHASHSSEIWRDDRTTVEFRGRYTINKYIDLYFDVYNIFNEPIRPNIRGGQEFYDPHEINLEGVNFAAGISGRF